MALSVTKIATLPAGMSKAGEPIDARYGDGRYGLYLQVKPSGARSWVQRLVIDGRRRTFGLGPYPVVSLREARDIAFENVRKRHRGIDPIAARKPASAAPTFAVMADEYIKLQAQSWRAGSRNETNWRSSLVHAKAIADAPVDNISIDDVIGVLAPIYRDRETLGRTLRQRIRSIFSYAQSKAWRSDNPADARLDAALPKNGHTTAHRESVEHADVADVLAQVRAISDPGWLGPTLALEFLVLTGARSGEVSGMSWSEIKGETWTVPASRMKTRKVHRVPLSEQALTVLHKARERSHGTGLVFRSSAGKRLDGSKLRLLLKRLGVEATVHGFRGSFKSWCMENNVDRAVAELSLAHAYMGNVEAAYVRTDMLEQRRPVMAAWGAHVTANSKNH